MKRVLGIGLPIAVVTLLFATVAAQAVALERVSQYGVGGSTTSAGGIIIPSATAVAPDGTVVVADQSLQRVNVFTANAQFLRAFGRDVIEGGGTGAEICTNNCRSGSEGAGSGELRMPSGLAVTADRIYVAEQGNNRVSVFNLAGSFQFAFGANVGGPGVNVCAAGCNTGTSMPDSGAMSSPVGLAIDSAAGLLYVVDGGNGRVDVFQASSGQFIRAFGKNVGGAGVNACTAACAFGLQDGTPGSVSGAKGIALGPEGNLFVGEGPGRVSEFTPAGQLIRVIGSIGSSAGQMVAPYGVAVTPAGQLNVADGANSRVATFTVGGDFISAMGRDVIPGAPDVPEVCTFATGCKGGNSGSGIGEFSMLASIASDCRGALYVGQSGRVDKFAEPGAASPPCPLPPSPATKPSNQFKFSKTVKANKKKGTLTVTVEVPGAGVLAASAGRKLAVKAQQPTAAGNVTIAVKATGKGVKALRKAGKLKGTLSVTFTPTGGDAATQTLAIELRKQKKGKGKAGKAGKGGKGKGAPGA